MQATLVNNYWVQLQFENPNERSVVANATSFEIPGAKFSPQYKAGIWDGTKRFLTAANKIPAGLFSHLFPNNKVTGNRDHVDFTFDDLTLYKKFPNFDRRQYQLDAVNAIFRHKRGIIHAGVSSGKTLISAIAAQEHLDKTPKGKVLFVCYDKNILQQTIENYAKYGFNVTPMGGGVKDSTGDVVVATIQTLHRLKDAVDLLKQFTFCVIDESHRGKNTTSKETLSKLKNCQYYIGLTATPPRRESLEYAELACVTGGIISRFSFEDSVNEKKVAPIKVFFVKYNSNDATYDKLMFRKHYATIWEHGIRDNEVRNGLIAEINSRLLAAYDKSASLICVDRTEHGSRISQELRNEKPSFLEMYGVDNILSREAKKEALITGKIDTIVSSVLAEGVDLPVAPIFAISALGRVGEVKTLQFFGRAVRKNPYYKNFRVAIDFIDDAAILLREHSDARIANCMEFGLQTQVVSSVDELMDEVQKYYTEIE